MRDGKLNFVYSVRRVNSGLASLWAGAMMTSAREVKPAAKTAESGWAKPAQKMPRHRNGGVMARLRLVAPAVVAAVFALLPCCHQAEVATLRPAFLTLRSGYLAPG